MPATTIAERRARLRGLYAITPETESLGRLLFLTRAALDGGARLVQYRAKALASRDKANCAGALLALCRELHVPFIVNDDIELAIASGADGVHLGRDDGDPRAARERWPAAIIGVSCYGDPRRAVAAAAAGADYVGVGSVFASATKPGAVQSGLAVIGAARRAAAIPVAAIGGITVDNAGEAVAAGADMIAVISALFEAPDVAAAARALSRPFDTEHDPHVRAQPAAI